MDFDDERNVAMSRARMASANAFKVFIDMRAFTPDEVRRQSIADGLFSITLPETIDRASIEWPDNTLRYIGNKGSNQVGDPAAPSSGGQGDTIPQQIVSRHRAKIEVSIAKAVYQANQPLGAVIYSVRNGDNKVEDWEKSFDDAVVGRSQADLVTESVISDTHNLILDTLDGADWLDTVSRDIAVYASGSKASSQKRQVEEVLRSKAEQEFIAGERDSLDLTSEEVATIGQQSNEIRPVEVKAAILKNLIPKIILVSKSSLLQYKYSLDTRDQKDNNNLKLAREIAENVYPLFPQILEDVWKDIN